jgi:MFS family permease
MTSAKNVKLPVPVVVLGFVSFFNELSSQIVAPLTPILLATVLGAGPVFLGLIEGFADAVASLLKLWAGRTSDVQGRNRKSFMIGGYGLSTIARPLIGLATIWPIVFLLRSLDRAEKGLRGAPRDALVADITPEHLRGRAFGINRAFDYAGAVGGSLIAAAALTYVSANISAVILLSAIPSLCAMLLLALLVQNSSDPAGGENSTPTPKPSLNWNTLSVPTRRFMTALAVFSLSRASESFIILRGHELGMPTVTVLLLWALLCSIQSGAAWLGGSLSDSYDKSLVVTVNWLAYGASMIALATAQCGDALWAAVCVYGLLTGIGEGAERALVSELAAASDRGTAFGWHSMITGLASLPASLMFGLVWTNISASIAFASFGCLAIVAALIVGLWPTGSNKI